MPHFHHFCINRTVRASSSRMSISARERETRPWWVTVNSRKYCLVNRAMTHDIAKHRQLLVYRRLGNNLNYYPVDDLMPLCGRPKASYNSALGRPRYRGIIVWLYFTMHNKSCNFLCFASFCAHLCAISNNFNCTDKNRISGEWNHEFTDGIH